MSARSDVPATSSMAMNAVPSISLASYTAVAFGCAIAAAARASRSAVATDSPSSPPMGWSTFRATGRCSRVSKAR